ncbi:MAG: nucleoside hydrolase [Candidatus Latescibacteria bacterium]|nr:nucleoside hydrolase [Candidatus Latescibacterota bacterium]
MTIPVLFDTDIGSDIDDTWALALLLRCPELDIKLVTTDRGRPHYRAQLACQILEADGRADLPVGLGPEWNGQTGQTRQQPCADGYDLATYPGGIIEDGVQAMIDIILAAPEPITVIAIGPLPTVAAALQRQPRIAENARFIGMHGALRLGHKRSRDQVVAEANVVNDPAACQAVFAAPWPVTITPLDSCGIVQLEGDKHRRVVESNDPLAREVIANYQTWWTNGGGNDPQRWQRESSILFDTVAVYLAFAEDLLVMEDLPVRVTDDGYTRIEDGARTARCATGWQNLGAFEDLLVDRLAP